MYFYQILNEIMNRQNLKIADVARMCDIADSTVRSIITRQQKTVALDVAFKLSDGLNIPLKILNGDAPYNDFTKENLILSDEEKRLIKAYRKNVSMQPAIKKMLDIDNDIIPVRIAAKGQGTREVAYTREQHEKALAALQDLDDDE